MKEFAFVDTTKITLEEKSYIYGLLITDGTINIVNPEAYTGQVKLELNKRDEDIIDKLCSIVPYSVKHERTRNTNFLSNYHSVSFNVYRQYFIKDLIDFGFPIENKTENAKPPIVEYDENAFWRGVLDGDGSIGIRKEKSRHSAFLSLTTKSEELKNAFCKYVNRLSGVHCNPKRNKRDSIYNITIAGTMACKILKEVYKNSTIHLDRKYNKYLECLKWEQEYQLQKEKPKFKCTNRQIVQLTLDGVFIKCWDRICDAAKFYNTSFSTIWNCCNKKQKATQGFKWMYKEEYDQWMQTNVL